jgi:catechol 2,3-dioxygenase-like lactoylglutathione lyase family enzyme
MGRSIPPDQVIPILPVRGLDETLAFYARLGFALKRRYPHHGYAIVVRGESELHFSEHRHADSDHTHAGCYLRVRDARALHQEWLAGGAEGLSAVDDKPWRMREFSVVDPSGNLVRVGQPLD